MKRYVLLTSVAMVTAGPALAGAIIAPVSGVIDSGGPGFGTLAETINQSGLSSGYTAGVTDFDTYLASNPIHTLVFSGYEWFSNDGTTSATVTYDFGGIVLIDAMALWNEESSGIGLLDLLGSTDGVTFLPILTGLMPTDNPYADYPADVFSFSATSLRYIRLAMSECPQPDPAGFNACAIGEVAFRTAGEVPVPEPAALGLFGLGLAGLGLMRRRSAR